MRWSMVCLILTLSSLSFADQAGAPNLLTNSDFADVKDRKPVGWTIAADGHDIYVDREDHPRESPQALKVEIRKAAEGSGAVTQTVRNVPANTRLVISGVMMGSERHLAYLQVTLKKSGKELRSERTDWNTDDWQAVEARFETGDADEVVVACRFSQSEKAKDEKVWFAAIRLQKANP